jgi:GNAT superfamily N-acetyltransferase
VAAVEAPAEIRSLAPVEFWRVGEIDRTERIDAHFEQRGAVLIVRRETRSAPAWDPDGTGEHSVDAQRRALDDFADAGGIACGAFSNGRLVGIGLVVPHLRPAIARLAYLHVSQGFRSFGIGNRLSSDLELIAHRAGDTEIVVTATPSANTVRFYLRRHYRPMATPLPELLELEPEDIHMSKVM